MILRSETLSVIRNTFAFLFFGLTPVLSLTSPCQQSLIDQCARLITGFTPQKYLSGLVPDSAIKDDCDAFASVRLCNDKVLRPCLAAELVTLDPFIRQANEFIMLFCENDHFRRDYAHHGQCLAVASLDINQCIANYGVTVSDIAAISDTLAPQEVLHRSCCDGLHRLTQCAFDAAVRKCHPSSADFVKKFLYKMMKSTLQDWIARQCFEYQSQCNGNAVPAFDEPAEQKQTPQLPPLPEISFPVNGITIPPSTLILTTSEASRMTPTTSTQSSTTSSTTEITTSSTTTTEQSTTRGNLADDEVPVSVTSVKPNANAPIISTVTNSEDFVPKQTHRPIAIKTAPEKSKHSSRIKNTSSVTSPLARKFLLLFSTIAVLAGWY